MFGCYFKSFLWSKQSSLDRILHKALWGQHILKEIYNLGQSRASNKVPPQKKKKMIMGLTMVESHLMGIQKVLREKKKL